VRAYVKERGGRDPTRARLLPRFDLVGRRKRPSGGRKTGGLNRLTKENWWDEGADGRMDGLTTEH
jgi:hypothetical protein